ncbi:MAG TPA: cytochrome c [Candidatus Melainabacteria bacterium]|nr:cytochrome c [Candidatus Melainabacteria bacterium]
MKEKLRTVVDCAIAVTSLCAVLVCFAPVGASGEENSSKRTGADIYKQYCSNCHVAGGNTAKPSKPLAGSKVLTSIATFQKYLEDPPGHMPYYKTIVTDKKLVKKLYDYCRTLKKTEGA